MSGRQPLRGSPARWPASQSSSGDEWFCYFENDCDSEERHQDGDEHEETQGSTVNSVELYALSPRIVGVSKMIAVYKLQ